MYSMQTNMSLLQPKEKQNERNALGLIWIQWVEIHGKKVPTKEY